MANKVLITANTAWNLVNFRDGLIRALIERGFEVVAAAPGDVYAPRLVEMGCRFVPLPMDNKGTHPGRDLVLLARFYRLLRREKPSVLLGYTIKPNIYGSLAAHALGIPVINNISGLGTAFIRKSWLTQVVRLLYRVALSRSQKVFFQNRDDHRLFVDEGLARSAIADRVPGSGVNLQTFAFSAVAPLTDRRFRFLLAARMLWDKGVGEYVEAARRLRARFQHVQFGLLGFLDVLNPAAISRQHMEIWVKEGIVTYFGEAADIRTYLAEADCIVLPSYREGTPRTLLEAAAIGRPIITTDTVGCREVVEDGLSGYLVKPRDPSDLAEKMERMMALTPEERKAMGGRGREKMVREFDETIVIRRYLQSIQEILKK